LTEPNGQYMTKDFELYQSRVQQLKGEGYSHSHASGLADLENRIAEHWPTAWGDDLNVLIYGDFRPPKTSLVFESLGITIEPGLQKNTVIHSAFTVLLARVSIAERSVASVKDAVRRLNLLVGILSYTHQGSPVKWWCNLTMTSSRGVVHTLGDNNPAGLLTMITNIPANARTPMTAAFYWLREPRSMALESQSRPDQLATFAGHWNAFECLVDVVNILVPPTGLTSTEKNAQINARLKESNGVLTAQLVTEMYRGIVDRGFREKASHAIRVCAGDHGERFITEAFSCNPPNHRLYAIRNAINHGNIDVNDPETTMLIESRFSTLFFLIRILVNAILKISHREQPDFNMAKIIAENIEKI
jgi:hypothetical protein